jgi:hypothetical protein
MLSQAIPQPAPTEPGGEQPRTTLTAGPSQAETQLRGSQSAQTEVELTFSADRNQLFNAWNAMANLADIAGKVKVTVRAENADGLDKSKLQNGVIEPLREADLID